MGLLALIGEIVDIFAVFPLRHALVVMASSVLSTDPMRIASEEGADLLFLTEVNHLPRGFMPKVTYPPFDTVHHFVLGALQLSPATGILLATRLLLGDLPVSHVTLPLEAANTTP